jgi:predicted nucleic acid-binding protein
MDQRRPGKMILDTNILITLIMDNQGKYDDFCYNHNFIAPSLIELELINILRKYHYLNSIPLTITEEYYGYAMSLIRKMYSMEGLVKTAKRLSFELNHPIYDCIYLALAIELDDAICSLDKKLLIKADSLNIRTYNFSIHNP